jgi:hypothetical protein
MSGRSTVYVKIQRKKKFAKQMAWVMIKEMKKEAIASWNIKPKQENENVIIGCSDVHVTRPLQDRRRFGEGLRTREEDGL